MAASASRVMATLFLVLVAQQVLVRAQQPPANRPLEGTYWKATELGGKPTPALNANREAHLLFKTGGVSGSNGCNKITGRYELKGEAVTFSQMAGTQMACIDAGGIYEFQPAKKAQPMRGPQNATTVPTERM